MPNTAAPERLVEFPLLAEPSGYQPGTFRYVKRDKDAAHEVDHQIWIPVFRKSIATFQKQAAADTSHPDAAQSAAKFARMYATELDRIEFHPSSNDHKEPLSCVVLCRLREEALRHCGFGDIYADIKRIENAKALKLLPSILRDLDTEPGNELTPSQIQDIRLEKIIRGIFAGNIFDLGASASAQLFEQAGSTFLDTREGLVSRPWAIDDLDAIICKLSTHCYRKAIIFVDNAGSDVVLGILPFARELVRRGTSVALAANTVHSINDITAAELKAVVKDAGELDQVLGRAVAEEILEVVESGNDLPVIDLTKVSPALAEACKDADLVVFEGMGRAIETNLNAVLKCDKLNLGMIKHPEVAKALNGRLYDCVCSFVEAGCRRSFPESIRDNFA